MKGKKWDLQGQKGLKWVSDRIHVLELPVGQRDFYQVSQRIEVDLNQNQTPSKA